MADSIKIGNLDISSFKVGSSDCKIYLGTVKLYPTVDPPTPEYTELEYIASTSTGSQYIDLNLQMFAAMPMSYQLDMKVNLIGNGSDNHHQSVVLGANREVNPWPGFVIRRSNSDIAQDKYPRVNSYGVMGQIVTIQQSQTDLDVTTHTVSTTLFAGFNGSGNPFRYAEMRVYYCKIWLNGTLVRDLVPMLRNADGVAGLYDQANDVFYTSPNGALFVYQE